MSMTTTDTWVGGALRRVTNAVAIAELHGGRSDELATITNASIEQAIQQALNYGFSAEAVATAAAMDAEEVESFSRSEG